MVVLKMPNFPLKEAKKCDVLRRLHPEKQEID
jgi:hypothetical protein